VKLAFKIYCTICSSITFYLLGGASYMPYAECLIVFDKQHK